MEPLRLFGIPISDIGYYMNWVLTNAQIELMAADVSVVDYNTGKDKNKRKKGEFDNTPADTDEIKKANEEWLKKYGSQEGAGTGLSIADVLGGGGMSEVGIKIK